MIEWGMSWLVWFLRTPLLWLSLLTATPAPTNPADPLHLAVKLVTFRTVEASFDLPEGVTDYCVGWARHASMGGIPNASHVPHDEPNMYKCGPLLVGDHRVEKVTLPTAGYFHIFVIAIKEDGLTQSWLDVRIKGDVREGD